MKIIWVYLVYFLGVLNIYDIYLWGIRWVSYNSEMRGIPLPLVGRWCCDYISL